MTACQKADTYLFFYTGLFVEVQLNVATEAEQRFAGKTKLSVKVNVTDGKFTVYLGHRN